MQTNHEIDITQAQKTIEATIKAVQQRKSRLSLESGLWVGLWYGLAMGTAPVVLDLAFGFRPPLPEPLNYGLVWGGILVVGALLVGAVVGLLKRTSAHDAAKFIDTKLDLKDRLSSALYFSKTPNPAERLAIADAAEHAKSVNPEQVLVRSLSKPPVFAVGTLLAGAVLIAGGYTWRMLAAPEALTPTEDASSEKDKNKRQKEIDKLAEEFKKLAEGAKKIGANQETQDFLERAKKDLERLQLEQKNLSKSEILSRLSELEKAAKDLSKSIDPKESAESMSRAAQSLEKGLDSKSVSDAMASQDFKKAAEELEKLAEEIAKKASTQTKEENAEKARELEKAANELKKQDPELAEALQKAAEAMEKGDFAELKKALEEAAKKMKRTPETLARRKASAKAMAAALERLEGAKVEVSDKPAYASGNAPKKSSGKKPSSGKKLGKPGAGKKPGKVTIKTGGGGESGDPGESGEGGEGGDMEMSMGNCDPSSEDCFMLPIPGGEGGEGGEGGVREGGDHLLSGEDAERAAALRGLGLVGVLGEGPKVSALRARQEQDLFDAGLGLFFGAGGLGAHGALILHQDVTRRDGDQLFCRRRGQLGRICGAGWLWDWLFERRDGL